MEVNEQESLVRALRATLESPNECDQNGEAANMVDGLFAIARAIDRLADVMDARLDTEAA